MNVGTPAGHDRVPDGVTVPVALVPAGVPALVAEVVWLEVPVNVGVLTVPLGVRVAEPPVVPTSPLALSVPLRSFPFRAETSVKPIGQVPDKIITSKPLVRPKPTGVAQE